MKIALCTKGDFSLEKGFTKNRIELAESLGKLGWETFLIDKETLGIPPEEKYNPDKQSMVLRNYLTKHSQDFDVVLYEYDTLPFNRNLFSRTTLFVARPAILDYHLPNTKFRYNLRTRIKELLKNAVTGFKKKELVNSNLKKIDFCLEQTDLIQVQNVKDANLLRERGFPIHKIIIIPNGITSARIKKFAKTSENSTKDLTIAFVGTFDFRKGAMDFGNFYGLIKNSYPHIKLKLLGTRGLFRTEKEVLDFFPKKYHSSIEVLPQFKAEDLPDLLKDCQIGVFPSYLESFGFGALEMMCAGLPVVAYDCPGPSDFILPDLLVKTGDYLGLSQKVVSLIENTDLLTKKSKEARDVVIRNYCWDDIARDVDRQYDFFLAKQRQTSSDQKAANKTEVSSERNLRFSPN